MGGAHSRRKPGSGSGSSVASVARMTFGANIPPPKTGYFILSLKPDKIKVVNAEAGLLRLLATIIRRHVEIVKEGWDRHLTYCYRLRVSSCHQMIQLVADTLMGLYQSGWEPMTPLEMGTKRDKSGAGERLGDIVTSSRVDICFRNKEEAGEVLGSSCSIRRESLADENCCLCLQTFKDSFLVCHNVSNTVLYEVVGAIQDKWAPGIQGVSVGVASVIQDYAERMPPVLRGSRSGVDSLNDKHIKMEGRPWRLETSDTRETGEKAGAGDGERLQTAIIGCVTRLGYRLSMDITLDVATNTRVFFLIKTCGDATGSLVTVPNNSGAGLGEKETLCVYRPLLVRHKSSFFRSYHGKSGSFRKKLRQTMRRKVLRSDTEARLESGALDCSQPVTGAEPAWWQQVSTDCSPES